MKLAIYGSGGAGCELQDMIERSPSLLNRWDEVVFIDDVRGDGVFRGHRTIAFDSFSEQISPEEAEVMISLGEPSYRKMLWDKVIAKGYSAATIIDPTAHVSRMAKIGDGVIVQCFAMISSDSVIDDNVSINPHCVIHHGSHIGAHSFIASGAVISGEVNIGDRSFVGAASVIRERITIGSGSIIGAGSVVISDIGSDTTAYGSPARPTDRCKKTVF